MDLASTRCIVTAAAVAAALLLTSCAGVPDPGSLTEFAPGVAADDPADVVTPEQLEALGYQGDGMSSKEHDLSSAISQRFGADPEFSGFEWDGNAGVMTLWWFGDVPASLSEALSASGVPVEIEQTMHSPAEIRDAARRITTPGAVPGVFIAAAGATIDCSKVTVTAESTDPTLSEADMLAAIEAAAGYPVDLTIGSIMLISAVVEP